MSAEAARPVVWHLASLMPDVPVSNLYPKKHFICCAARPNAMLIRGDGRISKCACHLNDPRNFVGRLDAEGRMQLDGRRIQPWFKGYDNFDSRMLSCPILAVPADVWQQHGHEHTVPINVGWRA